MSRVTEQYQQARQVLAGGVTASTRVNQAIGHAMLFERAAGCRVWDLDGKEYIDLCASHGAALLGHGHPGVRQAVEQVLARGAACSYESELHSQLGELLCDTIPCLDQLRLTGSGTEATMHCIRLARAFTGRTKLLRFDGNFHGYHDQVMFAADSVPQTPHDPPAKLSPISSGLVEQLSEQLVVVPYNRPDLVEEAFRRHGDELAAAICEPIFFNAGCIRPTAEFMATLRRCTQEHGSLLIFDEVLSAFRMARGGAQEFLGVTPDLCTLGKSVGGGYPLSVFGGRAEVMARLMPEGDCQHSGTYNGHPVPVAAGVAAVTAYREAGFYEHVHGIAERLYTGMRSLIARHDLPIRIQGLGARFGIYCGIEQEVTNYREALRHQRPAMLKLIAAAIDAGVYFHDYGGAAVHHGFSATMTAADVDEALARLDTALGRLSRDDFH